MVLFYFGFKAFSDSPTGDAEERGRRRPGQVQPEHVVGRPIRFRVVGDGEPVSQQEIRVPFSAVRDPHGFPRRKVSQRGHLWLGYSTWKGG